MICHVCGANMNTIHTNLPFKVSQSTIVIVKDLPVFQCEGCAEYLLDDHIMEYVEHIFDHVDATTELEVLKYAA
ncbi:YgiT-type zinc finger domain-containing protein [Candidatus Magnetomoraceae bacterium gMMP-13]